MKPDLPEYPWNVNLQVPMDAIDRSQPTASRRSRTPARGATVPNNDYWNVNGGPSVEPGLTATPADRSGHLVLVPRQQRGDPARDAVLRLLRPGRADVAARAGLDHVRARGSSRSSSRAASARTAWRSTTTTRRTRTRRSSRRTTTTRRPRRVHPGHAARAEARLAEPDVQDQPVPELRPGELCRRRRSRSSATTRWTCSAEPTAILPAHLRRRLLQHQPGRRHVPLGVREGPAAAGRRASRRRDRTARCR